MQAMSNNVILPRLVSSRSNPMKPDDGVCTHSAVYGPSMALVSCTWTPTHHTLPTYSMGLTRSDKKNRRRFSCKACSWNLHARQREKLHFSLCRASRSSLIRTGSPHQGSPKPLERRDTDPPVRISGRRVKPKRLVAFTTDRGSLIRGALI